jgi:hypothetical protein
VRSADARSAQIRRPDGVTASFQVSENKVEPLEAVAARNLLSKDDWRATLADECEPCWPKMSRVADSAPLARVRERLARTRPCPDGGVIGDSGAAEGVGPAADAGEEVPLTDAFDVRWREVNDGPAVNGTLDDVVMGDQVLQPGGGKDIDFVVQSRH